MNKRSVFRYNLIVAAIPLLLLGNNAYSADLYIGDEANVIIIGNDDNSSNFDEGVFIYSNAGVVNALVTVQTNGNAAVRGSSQVQLQSGGTFLTLSPAGGAAIVGNTSINGTLSAGNTTVNGTLSAGATTLSGATSINNTLSVNANGGSTELSVGDGAISTVGAWTQTGSTSITGATTINTTGNSATTIGAAGNTSAVSIYSGASTIQASNGTNTLAGTTNNISGVTNINASVNSATNINTGTSTGNVTIGNSANTTTIQSRTNNLIANGANASNNMEATGLNGLNKIVGTTNINVSQDYATNINTGSSREAVTIGNVGMVGSNEVTARSGNTTMSLTNNIAALTAGPSLASNGNLGTSSAANSGGVTVYNTAQTITTSVNDVVTGKLYQTRINGNLFIDGNAYINGTLDYVSRDAANTTVIGANPGTSNLAGATTATSGGMAVVMKGTAVTTTQTVVDANGKITNVAVSGAAPATESTAALTLTNGRGDVHGLVVTENKTTMSGGQSSSSLTLDDNGATFSNAQTGRPVRVHGVYDGKDDFDAVNVRQLGAGVAMASALAAMPQIDANKRFNLTAGLGSYLNSSALAIGGALRVRPTTLVRFGAAFSSNRQRMVNVGVGHSF
jgi:YadA-like membrane anchor domain